MNYFIKELYLIGIIIKLKTSYLSYIVIYFETFIFNCLDMDHPTSIGTVQLLSEMKNVLIIYSMLNYLS